MENSILDDIKKLLGLPNTDTAFDTDIIVFINSSFMVLNQLGVGPELPFQIIDNTSVWTDFSIEISKYNAVKTYIYLSVKLLFDPPSTSFVLNSMEQLRDEHLWRLGTQVPIPEDTTPIEEP